MITRTTTAAGLAGLALLAQIGLATAQEQKKPVAPNPVGAQPAPGAPPSQGWTGQVQQAPAGQAAPAAATAPAGAPQAIVFDAKQVEAVRKVSVYFNDLANLRGTFSQVNPDKKRMRGKFYVKKPGRFRFDYAPPSKQVIVSDGKYLAIQDLDSTGSEDIVELDNTPFRMLLRKDVDLMRDARILDVQEADDLIIVTLQDKSPDAPGQIRLFMSKKPQIDIKEWVTIDAQGGETRVEVADLVKTEELDLKLFKREDLISRKLQ